MHDEYHEMQFETTYPSGADEWYCPTCGRRFLLNMPPNYQRVILNVGDEFAIHSGSKGGLRMGAVQINGPDEADLPDQIIATLEQIVKDFDIEDSSNT